MGKRVIVFVFMTLLAMSNQAWGDDIQTKLKILEEALKKQEETIKAQQIMINDLKEQMAKIATAAVPENQEKQPEGVIQAKATGLFGGSIMTNPNISVVLNTYAYTSSLTNEELSARVIQGYTQEGISRRNGFNLEAAELYLFAPVDPYFNLYATIPVTEEGAELEEAYFVTSFLPAGHQVKGGKFKSGFGRLNVLHPHAWDFVDAPLPYRAFMGGEGIIEKGIQYTYLAPLPFYMLLGVEALQGENDVLFGADAANSAHAYSAFAKISLDVSDNATFLFGPSVITGKTKTDSVWVDSDFTGDSTLYGLELTYKWKSKNRGFKWQTEYLYRTQFGDMTDRGSGTVDRLDRNQDGLYTQGLFLLDRFEFGARYDVLGLFKNEYILNGLKVDQGRRPWRASGVIRYKFSDFGLLRLQYTHDESDVAGKANDEIFLQAVFSIGAHGAHQF